MSIEGEQWYQRLANLVDKDHGATLDRLGRAWSGHFRRVSLRLVFRRPTISRAAIEAALMHDALMANGRGRQGLYDEGLLPESVRLIELITPPPNANYFRDLRNVSPEENEIYRGYIQRIIESGSHEAVYLKLADVSDTINSLAELRDPGLIPQLVDRYIPSRDMLFAWTVSRPLKRTAAELSA